MNIQETGKAISYLRKKNGFTQQQFADILNVTDKAVSKWERGLSCPDIALLPKISILLDTDIESLLYGHHYESNDAWCGILMMDGTAGKIISASDNPEKIMDSFISCFMLAGITDILVENDANLIQNYLGDGSRLGLHIEYGCNRKAFAAGRNLLVYHGTTVLYGMDLTKFLQRAMMNHFPSALLVVQGGIGGGKEIAFDDNMKCIPRKTASDTHYYRLPLLFIKSGTLEQMDIDACSLDEMERELEASEKLHVVLIGRGFFRKRLAVPEDAAEVLDYFRIMERVGGERIACLEEIAWRRGLIERERFKGLIQENEDEGVRGYLRKIYDDGEA